jgi:hypothetical protein
MLVLDGGISDSAGEAVVAVNIRRTEELTPDRYDRTYPGTVVKIGNDMRVNVLGNVISARWADPLVVAEGDSVLVQFVMNRQGGLSEAIVRARVGSLARPSRATVTVVPPGSETVTVLGTDGRTYAATFIGSYSPVVGHEVMLGWNASIPTIAGQIVPTSVPPPPQAPTPPIPPPPPPPQTGRATYWASGSNTYWGPGGWGSWAGGRGRVYQGSYGSGPVYGGFFYGGGPTQLRGRAIDYCGLVLGNRIAAGNYNSPVTIHIYATDATHQPGGLYTGIGGPIDVTAWPGQGLTEYNISALAGHLLNGGGIGIYGDPYAGFLGRNEQADSGKLVFDWRM